MSAYRMSSVNLTRWQLALLVGAPLVIGAGYLVYERMRKGSMGPDGPGRKSKALKDKLNAHALALDGSLADKQLEQKKKKQAELAGEQLSPLKEATMFKNEGNNCYRIGKFAEAISCYDKAISKCPLENATDLAIFYQNRAAAYEMLEKWPAVKEDCSKSLEYNPRYAKAYFRRAKAHEATGHMLDCLDDITATCILEMFQNDNTIGYADRVLKQTGRELADEAMKTRVPVLPSNHFIRTYLRSFVADPLQAVALPESALVEPPRGFVRAKLAMEQEQYEEVIAACTEEIESSEAESQFKSEALLMRGTFHLLSGAFDDAQQDLDAVVNNADADANLRAHALVKRASLNIQLERKEEGLADFIKAEEVAPKNADIYHQRAQIYILIDSLPQALEQFDKALKLAPNHAMAYVQRCYAEYRQALLNRDEMRLMSSMNEFQAAIDKFPDCPECYSLLAQVLSDQQLFDKSEEYYEKAVKLAPYNASLYVHRGIMLLQWKGDVEKAVELINRALEVDDKCELAYETLGTIEVQRAKLDRSVELFEKAITLAKSQAEMAHLYSLRNAAIAQLNVTQRLGIDMSAMAALTQAGLMSTAAV